MARSHPLGMHCSLASYCGSIRPYAEGNGGEDQEWEGEEGKEGQKGEAEEEEKEEKEGEN